MDPLRTINGISYVDNNEMIKAEPQPDDSTSSLQIHTDEQNFIQVKLEIDDTLFANGEPDDSSRSQNIQYTYAYNEELMQINGVEKSLIKVEPDVLMTSNIHYMDDKVLTEQVNLDVGSQTEAGAVIIGMSEGQHNRLVRQLRSRIYEFTARVGQQAVVLIGSPDKQNISLKVFGSRPLQEVIRNLKKVIITDLETALAQQITILPPDDSSMLELPSFLVDWKPPSVEGSEVLSSSKSRKRLHSFEPILKSRRRIHNRIFGMIMQKMQQFVTRTQLQAVVLVVSPVRPINYFSVYGAKPLEDVVNNLKNLVIEKFSHVLEEQSYPSSRIWIPTVSRPIVSKSAIMSQSLFELPTPVEKMTQVQLRAFIPLMLKYSTGRCRPGWGRDSTKPIWWPAELPWANVRSDVRSEDEKRKMNWTVALRKIVFNCYKYHGREDLLPPSIEEIPEETTPTTNTNETSPQPQILPTIVDSFNPNSQFQTIQLIENEDGSYSIINPDPNNQIIVLPIETIEPMNQQHTIDQTSDVFTLQNFNGYGLPENTLISLTDLTHNPSCSS